MMVKGSHWRLSAYAGVYYIASVFCAVRCVPDVHFDMVFTVRNACPTKSTLLQTSGYLLMRRLGLGQCHHCMKVYDDMLLAWEQEDPDLVRKMAIINEQPMT